MKTTHTTFLLLFLFAPLTIWAQEQEDYKILEINNFAGLAGKENAVTITFPDTLFLSKVTFSYKAYGIKNIEYDTLKFSNDIQKLENDIIKLKRDIQKLKRDIQKLESDTLKFNPDTLKFKRNTLNLLKLKYDSTRRRKSKHFIFQDKKHKTTKLEIEIDTSGKILKFYIASLGKNKKDAGFDWGYLEQPKVIYNNDKEDKNKLDKWILREIKIYSKKPIDGLQWFNKKKPATDAPHPKLIIENLLQGYQEKGSIFKFNKTAFHNGVAPVLTLNNFGSTTGIRVTRPLPVETTNCGVIGITYSGNIQEDKELGKAIAVEDVDGNKSLRIDFFNRNAIYENHTSTCSPRIEVTFEVPEKKILPDLKIISCDSLPNPKKNKENPRDSVLRLYVKEATSVQNFSLDSKTIDPCFCGTTGGAATFNYTPSIVSTKSFAKCSYKQIYEDGEVFDTIIQTIDTFSLKATIVSYTARIRRKVVDTVHVVDTLCKEIQKSTQIDKSKGEITTNKEKFASPEYDCKEKKDTVKIIKPKDVDFLNASIENNTVKIENSNMDNLLAGIPSGSYVLEIMPKGKDKIIHTEPFIIHPGKENCSDEEMISERSPIRSHCISTVRQEDSSLPCQEDTTSIPFERKRRYLIIGLNAEDLIKVKDSDITRFNSNGVLVRYKSDKKLNCGECKYYEENKVLFGYEIKIKEEQKPVIIESQSLQQPIIIDLDKYKYKKGYDGAKITFKILRSKNDEPVEIYYQFISTAKTP